jgi:hypothetical protein
MSFANENPFSLDDNTTFGQLKTPTTLSVVGVNRLANAIYGASAQLEPTDWTAATNDTDIVKNIVTAGGTASNAANGDTDINVIPLQAAGGIGDIATATSTLALPSNQAFAEFQQNFGQLIVFGGYATQGTSGPGTYVTLDSKSAQSVYPSGTPPPPPIDAFVEDATVNNVGFFGIGSFVLGNQLFASGGAVTAATSTGPPTITIFMTSQVSSEKFDDSGETPPFAAATPTLARLRAEHRSVVLPPYIYLVSGVVCGADSADEPGFCTSTEDLLGATFSASAHIDLLQIQ